MRSDVEIPALEVPICPGVDWRIDKGLNVSRQQYLLRRSTSFRLNNKNGWRSQFIGLGSQGPTRPQPRDDARDDKEAHYHHNNQQQNYATTSRAFPGRSFRSSYRLVALRLSAVALIFYFRIAGFDKMIRRSLLCIIRHGVFPSASTARN